MACREGLAIASVLAIGLPWIGTGAHRTSRAQPVLGQSLDSANGIFQWAVFGEPSIKFKSSGAGTDSWDSRLGPYNPATAGSHGDLASNGDITLTNSTVVKGDVSAGGNVFNAAGVTGTITTHAPPIPPFPNYNCPLGGYTPSLGPLPPGVTYDPSTGSLSIAVGANLTLTGVFYYFRSVDLKGTLTFANGGRHADIWVSTNFSAGGGGIVNTAALPTALEIWSCGSSTTLWQVKSGAGAYFSLYAPNHDVTLTGNGDVFGAIVARAFTANNGSWVHYDEALSVVTGPIYGGTYGVTVSPSTTTASHLPSNGTTYPVAFTVQNTGDTTDSYDLLTRRRPGTALTTVSITGTGVTQGANPDSARLANLGAVSSATVTVTYAVGNVAAGPTDTVLFTARSLGNAALSDSGRLTLTVVRPSLTLARSVSPVGTEAPGTDLTYALTITNGGSSDAAGVAVVDTVPSAVQFKLGSVVSSPPAGVTALVEYSKDGGATWTYVPAGAACGAPVGYDRCVNRVRWRLQQPLSSGAPNNAGTVQFVAQIR